MVFRPFDPKGELQIHEMHLPHWRQEGVTYFVTSRLADSLPQDKLREWQAQRDAWLRANGLESAAGLHTLPEERRHEFHQRFTAQWHDWLDAGYGACWLRRPELRRAVVEALERFNGIRYNLDAWVVMPNHFHALVTPQTGWTLGQTLQGWKGASAREINLRLQRSGSLWQSEPYDHIVRSEAQLDHYRKYIAQNPAKAKLQTGEYALGAGHEYGDNWTAEDVLRRCANKK